MRIRERGFTLVELVVVIVILGILAAAAIPRYASYTTDARISSLNGVIGAINSANMMVQGRFFASGGQAANSPVTMADGVTTVAVNTTAATANYGFPVSAAGGICNAMTLSGFTCTPGAATATITFTTAVANCLVTYTDATGLATSTTTGC